MWFLAACTGDTQGCMSSLTQHHVCRNRTCVPENRESTVCLCNMLMEDMVGGDTYQLDLWAGKRWLWNGSFKPSEHGEWGRAGSSEEAGWAPGLGRQGPFWGGRPKQPLTFC